MMFKSGEFVYCIDDSRCDLLERGAMYQIANVYGSNAVSFAGRFAVYESWRFSKDKPESATNAQDAAAELAKIAKLLDDIDVPFSHSDTYGRVRCLAAELARHKRDEWQARHQRLSENGQ